MMGSAAGAVCACVAACMHAVNPVAERCRRMRIECYETEGGEESVATRSRIPTRLHKPQISRSTTLKWHQHGEPPSFIRFSPEASLSNEPGANERRENKFRTQKIDTMRVTRQWILINGKSVTPFFSSSYEKRDEGTGYIVRDFVTMQNRKKIPIVDAIRCNDGHSKRHSSIVTHRASGAGLLTSSSSDMTAAACRVEGRNLCRLQHARERERERIGRNGTTFSGEKPRRGIRERLFVLQQEVAKKSSNRETGEGSPRVAHVSPLLLPFFFPPLSEVLFNLVVTPWPGNCVRTVVPEITGGCATRRSVEIHEDPMI